MMMMMMMMVVDVVHSYWVVGVAGQYVIAIWLHCPCCHCCTQLEEVGLIGFSLSPATP
jgi:hypothetical protein